MHAVCGRSRDLTIIWSATCRPGPLSTVWTFVLVAAAEPLFDRADLVVERLVRPVAALVELQHGVDARYPLLERHRVQLADDGEDVGGRALQRRAHRVHPVAHPVLGGQT